MSQRPLGRIGLRSELLRRWRFHAALARIDHTPVVSL